MNLIIKDRKKIILIIALCVFAVSLIYRITNPYKQERVAKLTYTGQHFQIPGENQTQQGKASSPEEHLVNLDLFLNPPGHSRNVSSNIFSDQKTIPAVNEHIDVEKPDGALPEEITQTAPDKRKQVEDDLSQFKSFGYLETDGERTLFLERGKQIMVIRKGDRIDGKYIVKDITQKELTLTALSINEDIHIDLSEL
jgi:hypothetical protein